MQGKHGRIEVDLGPRLELEVAEGIGAPHEGRAVSRAARLTDARGNIADGEADATIPGGIGARAVHHQHVMERHLSRLKDDVGGPRFVHLHGDLLAAREEIVGMERVDVGDGRAMAPRNDPHVAVGGRALGEGNPRRDHVRLGEPPVRGVLMPGHEARAPRFLGEEGSIPAENIRAQHVLRGVQHRRMPDQIGEPCEEQMRLDPIHAAQRSAQIALGALELLAILPRLARREHGDGEDIAVARISLDGRRGQALAHAARRPRP